MGLWENHRKGFYFHSLAGFVYYSPVYSFSQPLKIKTQNIRMKKQGDWSEYIHRNECWLRDHLEENKIKGFSFAPRISDIQ